MVSTTDIATGFRFIYIYSSKKERQHAQKYNLLPIFNIILNTEKKEVSFQS
jgi:hypothetical protein